MIFRIAGWAIFGITCVVFGAAEVRARRLGTTPSGSVVPCVLVLAITVGLGIAATTTRSSFLTLLFVCWSLAPWVGIYNKIQERRESAS